MPALNNAIKLFTIRHISQILRMVLYVADNIKQRSPFEEGHICYLNAFDDKTLRHECRNYECNMRNNNELTIGCI